MGKYAKDSEKPKKNRTAIIIIILLIIIVILLALLMTKEQGQSSGGVSLNVDKDAGKFVPTITESSTTKNVAIPGWGSITIPANKTNVTVDFYNPEENDGLYYLTFELRLLNNSEQGYEVLYTSGLVEPGLHIQNIELSRGIEIGTYDAVIHVQPYRMDEEKTPTNNADMNTKLIVK